jgi:hypothetical protein
MEYRWDSIGKASSISNTEVMSVSANNHLKRRRKHHYLAGLAVDSGDPQNIIVSASHSAFQTHWIESAESLVYRRSSEEENNGNSEVWNRIQKLRKSSMLSTIVEHFVLLIHVFHGKCLTV